MKRIDKLTPEQIARFGEWREKWIAIGLSTEPADRPKFERAVRECYGSAGLAPPKRIVWVDSPLALAYAGPISALLNKYSTVNSAVYSAVGSVVNSAVDSAVYSAVGSVVNSAVNLGVGSAVDSAVDSEIHSAVDSVVNSAVDSAVYSAVNLGVGSAVNSGVGSAVYSAVGSVVNSAVDSAVYSAVNLGVGSAVDSAVDSEIHSAVDSEIHSAVYSAVYSAVGLEVGSAVNSTVRSAVGSEAGDLALAIRAVVTRDWNRYLGGQFWVGGWWGSPAIVSFFREVCGLDLPKDIVDRALANQAVCESACWWWPHREFVIACERPRAIHRDPQGRLHSETGKAIEFRDGWGVSAWHGTVVPHEWIADREKLTPSIALSCENLEQRRAACEILGWAKILGGLNARVIDEDHPRIGTLVEVDLPGSGKERFLRVLCGTGREFALPVAPDVDTAYAANLSTYPALGQLGLRDEEIRDAMINERS